MEKELFIQRINILKMFFLFFAFTLVIRMLTIVLNYSFLIKGETGTAVAFVIVILSGNFVYIIYRYIKKFEPSAMIGFNSILSEWKLSTLLNKVLIVSGLLSLSISIITIGQWLTSYVLSFLQK